MKFMVKVTTKNELHKLEQYRRNYLPDDVSLALIFSALPTNNGIYIIFNFNTKNWYWKSKIEDHSIPLLTIEQFSNLPNTNPEYFV